MLSEMICSSCKDVVETSAKTVALPYVCEECLTFLAVEVGSKVERNPIYPVQGLVEPTQPEPPPLSEILETEKGQGTWTAADGSQQIQFTTPLPSDESTATVENTTLLIADLEQQIADSKEALDKSTELIGDLTQQLAKAKENLGLYDEAGRMVTGLLLAASKKRDVWRKYAYTQTDRIEELTARISQLEGHNKQLWDDNNDLIDSKRYFWKKAFFYENLGFWGRLFNSRYSGKLVDPRGF